MINLQQLYSLHLSNDCVEDFDLFERDFSVKIEIHFIHIKPYTHRMQKSSIDCFFKVLAVVISAVDVVVVIAEAVISVAYARAYTNSTLQMCL